MNAYRYDAIIRYVSSPGKFRELRLVGKPVDRINKAIKNCRATTKRNIKKMTGVLGYTMILMPRCGGDSAIWFETT